ncbi:MAG TPA: condensation domain-containing protein, partial [Pseudoxanthomonas sp.]|nr:condensation domain-containing protein [Pseudoxanthomonas sp.]
RIELGEIETTLMTHPALTRAVAMAREDRPGDVRLVAYVVPASTMEITDALLVAHLKQHLPDYMVPQHFVSLPAIPLLPNGKVDRKSLPAPEPTARRQDDMVAPRNELERKVAAIMASVLGLPEIGVHDNFFASGGHSLLAAQLTSRINREFGLGLSLRTLFDAPTVEKLAGAIGNSPQDSAPPRAPIVHRADQRQAPLSLIQERLKLLEDFNPGQLTYNTPSAHWLTGPLDVARFDQAFQSVMQRQSVLRTTIEERDGDSVQVIHDHLDTGLAEVEDLTHLPLEERERVLMHRLKTMVETPFQLVGTPLFRARLFKFDDERHALLFMTHHIIWDGWSFDLFYRDLAETYAAQIEGREPDLPALSVSYGDFSVWHREWVRSEEYARQLEFWRQKLGAESDSDNGGALDLSGGKPRKPSFSGRGMAQTFHVDRPCTEALRRIGLSMDATLFVVLLTAYLALLNRLTSQKDIIVATPVRGRNSAEVEDLMGYFTNLLPLRARIEPDMPFAAAVATVKEVVLDSFAHPDIRLEEVARELSTRGGHKVAALYQTLFSMQDIRQRVTRWGNLRHERLEVFQPGATEDLGLWLLENDDGLIASLVYNADLLVAEDVAVLRRNYANILHEIARDPARSIASLACFDADGERLMRQHQAPQRAVTAEAAKPSREASSYVAPRNGLERTIATAMAEVLVAERVGIDDDFFDLGGHSMVAVQLFQRLRVATGVNLPLARLLGASTPRELAKAYRDAGAAGGDDSDTREGPAPEAGNALDIGNAGALPAVADDPWAPLVPLQQGTDPTPLFLIHAVGGNVLNYRALARKLPRSLSVYGLQALGLDGRTRPLQTVEAMASRYVQEILNIQPHGPYRIAGGSMGGIISYEIAQQLVAAGEQVVFLGLFDTSSGRAESVVGPSTRLQRTLRRLSPQRVSNGLRSRWQAAKMRLRVALARAIGAELPHAIRYQEVHRVHYRASCRYCVQPYPGSIVVFRAEDQEGRFPDSPTLGWAGLVGEVEVIDIPGNHDDLVEAPELARALERYLTAGNA